MWKGPFLLFLPTFFILFQWNKQMSSNLYDQNLSNLWKLNLNIIPRPHVNHNTLQKSLVITMDYAIGDSYEIVLWHSRWKNLCCNSHSYRKWIQQPEFKSWTRQSILSPAMGQTELFNLGIATSLGEGKLWIQTYLTLLKIDLVLHPTMQKGWINAYHIPGNHIIF